MMGITDLWTYIVGVIVIVLLPGPNSLFVLSVASHKGISAGYRAACGVFVGDAFLMAAASLGIGTLFKALPSLFFTIKLVGALYLAWLGLQLLNAARQHQRTTVSVESKSLSKMDKPFQKALLISLINPKAILFFATFFIQFVDPTYAHPFLSFLILGAIGQTASLIYLSCLIFSGVYLAQFFRQRVFLNVLGNVLVGLLFIGFAARLALSQL